MEPRGATHEAVARAAKDAYEALPKRGKPQPHERTVLAAFLVETTRPGPVGVRLDVVALGTGTNTKWKACNGKGGLPPVDGG
eukprot:jgi/Pico_ML_1/53837/g4311.t2